MKKLQYKTSGTCSRNIAIAIKDGVVTDLQFFGGCVGNLAGMARLAKGRKVQDLVDLLSGIQCQNGTSCPDQLAKALKDYLRSEQSAT